MVFILLFFTINILFFTDSTIHKIYIDKGKFDINYQIPKILYSTIISSFINAIIRYLSLTERNILEIKNYSKSGKNEEKIKVFFNCLKIKYITFI